MDANMFGTCTASLSENNANEIIIAPNPAQIKIDVSGLSGNGTLQIKDLFGKTIHQIVYDQTSVEIELQQLQNGIYFISEPTKGIYEKFIKN
jgi:hypothetical protein